MINRLIKCRLTQSISAGALGLCMALPAIPALAQMSGYKVQGNAGLSIRLTKPDVIGLSRLELDLVSKDPDVCNALVKGVPALLAVCEKIDKDGLSKLSFTGNARKTNERTIAGLANVSGGNFPLELKFLGQGSRLVIAQVSADSRPEGSLILSDNKMAYDGLASSIAPPEETKAASVTGYRLGASTVGEVELTPVDNGKAYQVRFKLDAKVDRYGYDAASADCYRAISDKDPTWIRQCEKASKDGVSFEVSGKLSPVSWRRNAYSGEVQGANGRWAWQMLVVDPQDRRFDVALSKSNDPDFKKPYTLLEFDTMLRPLPDTPPPAPPAPKPDDQATQIDCDALVKRVAGLEGAADRQRASALLSGAGFWGGILPQNKEDCAKAHAALDRANLGVETKPEEGEKEGDTRTADATNAWIFQKNSVWRSTSATLRARIKGRGEFHIEVKSGQNGQLVILIPSFDGCYQGSVTCQMLGRYPGKYPIWEVANGPDVLSGMFNAGGDLFIIRFLRGEKSELLPFISRVEKASTMGLVAAEVLSP